MIILCRRAREIRKTLVSEERATKNRLRVPEVD